MKGNKEDKEENQEEIQEENRNIMTREKKKRDCKRKDEGNFQEEGSFKRKEEEKN